MSNYMKHFLILIQMLGLDGSLVFLVSVDIHNYQLCFFYFLYYTCFVCWYA